jgi:hypothetical protein
MRARARVSACVVGSLFGEKIKEGFSRMVRTHFSCSISLCVSLSLPLSVSLCLFLPLPLYLCFSLALTLSLSRCYTQVCACISRLARRFISPARASCVQTLTAVFPTPGIDPSSADHPCHSTDAEPSPRLPPPPLFLPSAVFACVCVCVCVCVFFFLFFFAVGHLHLPQARDLQAHLGRSAP